MSVTLCSFIYVEDSRLPKAEWFDTVGAVEYLDATDGFVVVLVVEHNSLLHYDLLGRVADIHEPEDLRGQEQVAGWRERTLPTLSTLPCQRGDAHPHSQHVLHPVSKSSRVVS